MDTERGDTIYVEAMIDQTVELRGVFRFLSETVGVAILTTDEARVLANALLAATVEAEAYGRQQATR